MRISLILSLVIAIFIILTTTKLRLETLAVQIESTQRMIEKLEKAERGE